MDRRALRTGLVLMLPALLFGFIVTAQWLSLEAPAFQALALRYTDPLSDTATRLQDEQNELKREIGELRAALDEVQRTTASQDLAVYGLVTQIEELRGPAGLTALSGEGLVVRLAEASPPPGQEGHVCYATDLTDILNAAWHGGASGVSIGGERIVASSSVYCVGATMVVNGSLMGSPFEITIVGAQRDLLAVLDDPAQLVDLKRRRDRGAVQLDISRAGNVTVPAYSGAITVRATRTQ